MTLNIREITLLLISTLTVLAGATIAPSLPYIANQFAHLQHSEFWAQLALALPGICVAISAAWIGKQTAGRPIAHLLIIALLGYGVFGIAYWFAPTWLALLLVSRGALGFCVAAIMIMTTLLLVKGKTPQKRGQLLGYQAAAGGFGGVLYMALANELTQWHGLAPFGLYAIAWLLALLLWLSNSHSTTTANANEPLKTTAQRIDAQVDPKPFRLFAILATLEMLVLYALVLQVPLLTIATPYLLSAGLTLALLAMALTAAFYGKIQRFLSVPLQHALGFFVVAVGFALLAVRSNAISLAEFSITLCMLGVGIGLLRPNLMAWLLSGIVAPARPAAMGKITAVFFSAQFIAPFIVYPIAKYAGSHILWVSFSLLSLVASCYLLTVTFNSRIVKSDAPAVK